MHVEAPARPELVRRGRNRETWSATTTATVVIRDREAVREAFAELEESAYTLVELTDLAPDESHELSPLDQVAWLVLPTTGLDDAVEADAFRILSVEAEVIEDHGDEGTLRWAVTVKLRDVDRLRRLAVETAPMPQSRSRKTSLPRGSEPSTCSRRSGPFRVSIGSPEPSTSHMFLRALDESPDGVDGCTAHQ
jgi:hypothetical protein